MMLRTHRSLGDFAMMATGEQRAIFPRNHSADMKMVRREFKTDSRLPEFLYFLQLLTYFYSKCIILPPFDAFARVGRLLSFLFDRNQIDEFFAQWQDIVVNEILNAEVSFFLSKDIFLKEMAAFLTT